ncbi:MAG: hypothetical protein ACYDH6_01395 [Acidimicrobiales bacterium]
MDDIEELMAGLDVPTALPPRLRSSLGATLAEPLLAGIDAPRPLPDHLRIRLTRELHGRATPLRRFGSASYRWLAVAAAIVLVGGTVTAVVRNTGRRGTHSVVSAQGGFAAGAPTEASGSPTAPVAGMNGSAALATPSAAGPGGNTAGGAAGAGATSGATSVQSGSGMAPPFAASAPAPASEAALPAASGGAAAPATPQAGALTIAAVAGNASEEAGFDAYIALLNEQGGINGRTVRVVKAGSGGGAVATVNLSNAATPATAGPVLETLPVPDSVLRGSVFDVASAPVHQAVAAVNVMFPTRTAGQVAVVYRGAAGVWASDVPNAMVSALRQRGVTPIVMTYVPGQQFAPSPAGVALLALDTADAKAWFADAARAAYHPMIGGIESLVEPSLASSLADGTRAVGPYNLVGSPGERDALASGIGTQPGTAAVHGWVTAKVLAVALWRSGATTADATRAALAAMGGYDDGFAPPLASRPGTNSRVPDGAVFTVHNHQLQTSGAFVRDPA